MSTFGSWLRVTTFGESHGPFIGVVVDGFPSGEPFPYEAIQRQLDRRRPGQSSITSTRSEQDQCRVISGIQQARPGVLNEALDRTLGSPITLLIPNLDMRPQDYHPSSSSSSSSSPHSTWIPRPGHADLTYMYKYGLVAHSGGGRASARETAARVAAGALAEAYLRRVYGIEIVAYVSSVGRLVYSGPAPESRAQVDASAVRCPEPGLAREMQAYIEGLQEMGDSTGGTVRCVVRSVPAGLGEPVFDKLTARLAYAMMSIPSSRGFEMGQGFAACTMRGSEHNDALHLSPSGILVEEKNDAGGTLGGISTGSPLLFQVAFKPPSTIGKTQHSIQIEKQAQNESMQLSSCLLASKGRHDPCVVPRAVPIVEAMTALTLMDFILAQKAKMNAASPLSYEPCFPLLSD